MPTNLEQPIEDDIPEMDLSAGQPAAHSSAPRAGNSKRSNGSRSTSRSTRFGPETTDPAQRLKREDSCFTPGSAIGDRSTR
jgi:hypothetical protein